MSLKKLIFLSLFTGIFHISCEKEDGSPERSENFPIEENKISKEALERISELHFNRNEVEIIDFLLPDGTTGKKYLLEGDILMDPKQLDKMHPANITTKQYRTHNLVSSPRTIRVIGFIGSGGQALSSKQRIALQQAIENYNDLNIDLEFTLSFGTNYSAHDIVVYQNPNGAAGGVAGFPSGGNPYKYVQIFSGMNNYTTATNEHVITHELGHAVGLRHTDWASRQSCGQTGESVGWDGAVHIPGTPTGYDSNSLMLACFSSNEDGNFGYYDKVALNYLY